MICTLAVLAGCAQVRVTGQDFRSGAFGSLRLGENTEPVAEALLGPPYKRTAIHGTANNPKGPLPLGTPINLTLLTYAYGLSSGGAEVSGRPVSKNATLVFVDGTLAAYDFISTIPGEENPPIDESKLTLMKEGSTTRDEVIGLMGTPTGQARAIAGISKGKGAATYVWVHIAGGAVQRKLLRFDFDARDVMTHYTMVDTAGPLPPLIPGLPGVVPFTPYVPPYRAPQKAAPGIIMPKSPPTVIRS
jgi:hypothetical protein